VIARLAVVLLFALLAPVPAAAGNGARDTATALIYIEGLPQPVEMAPADYATFTRRLNLPPELPPRPPASGPSYGVDSPYWDLALRQSPEDPQAGLGATYFPLGGYVQTVHANRDAWLVLDLRQRALLDRYIRLGRAGLIGARPGAFQVLIAAAQSEPVSVQHADSVLGDEAARALWAALAATRPAVTFIEPPRPPPRDGGYWLTFTTAEGRSLQYFYDRAAATLTDALGTETYAIPGILPVDPGPPLQITQQAPRGSLLWWPLMLAGGAILLAAAVWTQQRFVGPQTSGDNT
jgi:hypothetical protein